MSSFFFFFNDTATTEIYTLSLHDALPISPAARHLGPRRLRRRAALHHGARHQRRAAARARGEAHARARRPRRVDQPRFQDRKSTRLNSSHSQISYAVFCLKKKKNKQTHHA